jgi:ribosome maturation factor RimP
MRYAKRAFFIMQMTLKEKVTKILNNALEEFPDLFLIEMKISDSNKIEIILDGDTGVNLQDCINISRAIEHNLDREETDFALEVSSAGANAPLIFVRQYKKNIGRELKVKTISQGEIKGKLIEADQEGATLFWKAREPKKIGKGKETIEKSLKILYSDIKESVVIISF